MESVLFKYTTIDTLEKILDGCSLKFTNPLDFNDPFDCNFPGYYLDRKYIEKTIRKTFKKLGVNINSIQGISGQIDKLHNAIFSAFNDHLDGIRQDWDLLISDYRILCVTDKKDNILMWSHYSDSHRGSVLGIDFSFLKNRKPDRVTYEHYGDWFKGKIDAELDKAIYSIAKSTLSTSADEYTENTFSKNMLSLMAEYFYFKREDWRYEREYRAVIPAESFPNDLCKIPSENIKEIIFGVNSDNKAIDSLITKTRKISNSIKLYKAVKHKGGIAFNEIPV